MIVGGAFAAAAVLISVITHLMHATHYSNPREQVKYAESNHVVECANFSG